MDDKDNKNIPSRTVSTSSSILTKVAIDTKVLPENTTLLHNKSEPGVIITSGEEERVGKDIDIDIEKDMDKEMGKDLEKGIEVLDQQIPDEPVLDPFCISTWEEGEPACPLNWSSRKRFALCILASALCFCSTFASSLPSGAFLQIQQEFDPSTLQLTLVTSLFVAGYVVGPILHGPLSEKFGRRIVFLATFFGFAIFTIPCAVASSIPTLLVARFLSGFFAASSLSNSGAVIADLYPPKLRGLPFAAFSTVPTTGPLVAPLVAAFIATRFNSFRPVFWLQFTFVSILFVLIYFCLPETYHPILLKRKAASLRNSTGDERYYSPADREDFSVKTLFTKTLARPLLMLTEPIVFAMSLYLSLVYGVIYLSFELYPSVFVNIHGFSTGIASIPFLAVAIGVILGYASVPHYEGNYRIAFTANGDKPVPEERLKGLFFGAPCFTLGLFIFGWTSNLHWSLPTLAGIPLGYGIFHTFQSCLNYIADVYQLYAASAFSAAQMARASAGFIFPLFAFPMINKLGVPITATVLGSLSAGMIPIPFLFFRFGSRVRKFSKLAF